MIFFFSPLIFIYLFLIFGCAGFPLLQGLFSIRGSIYLFLYLRLYFSIFYKLSDARPLFSTTAIDIHSVQIFCRSWRLLSFQCTGFSLWFHVSCRETQAVGCAGFSSCSTCGPWAPEHRFIICGVRAWLLQGVWDLPSLGIEPMSPALAGRFLYYWATRETLSQSCL